MTQNRRIALNVAATYGRSLYALIVGLFAGRWLLMALGETDYGLYGLVGGLAVFVSFFSDLLSMAVERFFAFSIGASGHAGLEECRRWFSVAALSHVLLSLVLVAVGYPLGVWAIEDCLNIPPDRVDACVAVFRFVCVNCFVWMVTVPCSAMYRAKQEIAELTVYGVVQTTANAAVLGYMVTHPGVWLVDYAVWWCAVMTLPQIVLSFRAFVAFPECRFCLGYAFDGPRILKLAEFAGSRFLCAFGQALSGQGLAVVVNKYLGVAKNAAMTVSNSVSGHVTMLSNAMSGAFLPAITNAAGAGDFPRMRDYAYRVCTLSSLGFLLFAIPISLEIDEILRCWLVNPPEGAALLCLCILASTVFERLSEGHWMSVFARGEIRRFQAVESFAYIGAFLLGWGLVASGWGILGIGLGVLFGRGAAMLVKLRYGAKVAGLSTGLWLNRVVVPILVSVAVTLAVGAPLRFLMAPSFGRAIATAVLCLAAFLPLAWFLVLSPDDRKLLLAHVWKK